MSTKNTSDRDGGVSININKLIHNELSDEEHLKLFEEECNGYDLMQIGDMINGPWSEVKEMRELKNKFISIGVPLLKVRQKVDEMKSTIEQLTKNKVDVGITTLFIQDNTERLKKQL